MQYGRLTVLHTYMKDGKNRKYRFAHCICKCGATTDVEFAAIKRGHISSCGCLKREMRRANQTHGLSSHRLYKIWCAMKQRCYDTNSQNYHLYGGRGISICKEWLENFKTFFDWANLTGYSEDGTIDRINNSGNYEPSNCQWVTQKEQNRNQRTNKWVTAFGETKIVTDWINDPRCDLKHPHTILDRIEKGMTPEDAITRKANKKWSGSIK